MGWWRVFFHRCAAFFRNGKLDQQLEDELRVHIDLATLENCDRGMSPDEARAAALRSFGGVTQIKETYRSQRGLPWLEEAIRDLQFALRGLRKSPGFTSTALLTLAVGIGAVTSVFSVVNAVLLTPFAFSDPQRLIVLREATDDNHASRSAIPVNYRHFLRLVEQTKTIETAVIFHQRGSSVGVKGEHPKIVGTVVASSNLFRVLGIQPMLGRGFAEADSRKGAESVVVLSYEAWQELFGGDKTVIGRTLLINGESVPVIGVLPLEIKFPKIKAAPAISFYESTHDARLFQPLQPSDYDLKADIGNFNYRVIARLKQGTSILQASAELDTLQKSYSLSAHLPLRLGISLTPLTQDAASGISGAIWLMFAAVSTVLLIACVNLASLQLARAVNAERQTAVRAALGANRLQLIRSRLSESLLLGLAGGTVGAALAFGGVRLFVVFAPMTVSRLDEVSVNLPVLLFAAGMSILSAVAFGLFPALHSLRVKPQTALQTSSVRVASSRNTAITQSLMVAAQVACTVVLLIVTAVVLSSFSRLMRKAHGFETSHVTLAEVDLFTPQYGDDKGATARAARLALIDRVLSALSQLPGVQSVAVTSVAPLTGETWVDNLFRPDHPVRAGKEPAINVRWIDPQYLSTMHISVVAGRNFTATDRANPYVALISEKTSREGFPGELALGHDIANIVPNDEHAVKVIGVVADTRINGLKDEAAMVYLPYWDYPPFSVSFLVRSSRPETAVAPEVRRAIWQIDSQLAIPLLKSMDEQLSESVGTDRFEAIIITSFGLAALLLALLGIYGVLAYSVSLRHQEFGIRIALGSGKGALVRLVLSQAAYPVLSGIFLGLWASQLFVRWVNALLYQAPTLDLTSVGATVLLVLLAAMVAAILPARRAASVDPIRALRVE